MPRPDTGATADRDGIGTDPPRSRSQVWAALARFAAFSVVALLAVLAGTVVIAERATRGEILRHAERTAGDIALMHRHVEAFCGASAQVGIDPRTAPNLFPDEVVALVLEADTMFDQTPGPHAGRRIEVVR